MDLTIPTLAELFDQLALPSSEDDIAKFAQAHPLPDDVKLVDADFWTSSQAAFLKEELRDDAKWAPVVDELNALLHKSP